MIIVLHVSLPKFLGLVLKMYPTVAQSWLARLESLQAKDWIVSRSGRMLRFLSQFSSIFPHMSAVSCRSCQLTRVFLAHWCHWCHYGLLCIAMYHCCVPLQLPIGAVRVARSAENSDLTRTTRRAAHQCDTVWHSGPDFHTLHRGLWNSMKSSHENIMKLFWNSSHIWISPKSIPNSQKQKQLPNTQWVKYVYCPALLTLEVGRTRRNHSTNTLRKTVFPKAFAILWPKFPKLVRRLFPKERLSASLFTSST